MLDRRAVSAVELLEQTVARIEAHDAQINAVVVRDFQNARAATAAADASLARGERLPLLGLPMTEKESFNVTGLPTTWGTPANEVYGTTNNPWDRTRTPGGSSGGAAASLASGYVALELGSDINGYILQPAHCCGVYGHKPSTGLVPLHGHVPPPAPSRSPIVRWGSVLSDRSRVPRAISTLRLAYWPVPMMPTGLPIALVLPPPRHERLAEFRILLVDTHPLLPTAGAIRDVIDRVGQRLGKAGATVAPTSSLLPDLAEEARLHRKRCLAAVFH